MGSTLEDALVLEEIAVDGYEKVIQVTDARVSLRAVICLHDCRMGPALGGTRIYPYATVEEALTDVKRLARGMTYKSAVSGMGWGGGKSVILADPRRDKTEGLLLAFGEAVNRLKGRYICAEDVGSSPEDMLVISRATPCVVGLPSDKSSGNPSCYTAWGTFRGIQAVLRKVYGSDSCEGRTVAIQGLGNVGALLAEFLFWHGARLILSDIDEERVSAVQKRFHARSVPPEEICSVECDVLAPCAMGGVLHARMIPALRCKAVAGCANNQLLTDHDAEELMRRGILYAPDFVINAGGLINVSNELTPQGYNPQLARDQVDQLYDQLTAIFAIAEQNGVSTHAAAIALGDYRLKYGIGKRQAPVYFHHANRVL
jgi:leucine dehydrogenase